MSDIFISYASEDRAKARVLADALERQGWTVWWDRIIPAGRTFDEVIEDALDAAKTVIVLWSEKSVKSRWVRTEAQEGADRKIIIPVLIEKVRIPLAFRRIQAADLIGWDGSYTSSFQGLVGDIAALLGPPPKEQEKRQQAEAEAKREDVGASEQIEIKPTSEAALPTNLFKNLPQSFCNPIELNAEYILIPGGQYNYSVTGQIESVPDIYFAKYPVTNKLYRRFINYLAGREKDLSEILPAHLFSERMLEFAATIKGFKKYLGTNPKEWASKLRSTYDQEKRFKGDNQPVVGISWYDARAYCIWLSLSDSALQSPAPDGSEHKYRLPTEVEWEWAAGGGKRVYPWSQEKGPPTDKLANYVQNVGATTPVGRYPEGATPEGLMDMAGNVWEWMENWYDKDEGFRSLRGGSWNFNELVLRCSVRGRGNPVNRYYNFGFRVVRSQS